MRTIISISMLMIALISCADKPEVVAASEYVGWTEQEENGLVNAKTIGDVTYTVYYLPKESLALREVGEGASEEELKAALEKKGNMQYYKLIYRLASGNQDILKYNLTEEAEYFSRSNYLAFGVDKDVYVQCGQERLPCRLHEFAPSYGIKPQAEVVFAFDDNDIECTQNRTLVVEDQLFGGGILQFEFRAEDLKNIPTIQF
jgi:hypothetical protein